MKTEASGPKDSEHAMPHAGPATSPLRLMILLGVLVVVVGALVYDWVIAPPRVEAADKRLLTAASKHNEVGLHPVAKKEGDQEESGTTGGLLYSADIQKIIGMAPTKVEKHDQYTIEHFCWWGWIPRKANYITVLYVGNPAKPHYSTHYVNMMPEDISIPGMVNPEIHGEQPSTSPKGSAGTPGVGGPAMGGPGMGPPPMGGPGMSPPGMGPPGAGGGKGKGRPQAKGDKKGDTPKGTEEGTSKASDPAKADVPKPDAAGEGEKKESAKEPIKESK